MFLTLKPSAHHLQIKYCRKVKRIRSSLFVRDKAKGQTGFSTQFYAVFRKNHSDREQTVVDVKQGIYWEQLFRLLFLNNTFTFTHKTPIWLFLVRSSTKITDEPMRMAHLNRHLSPVRLNRFKKQKNSLAKLSCYFLKHWSATHLSVCMKRQNTILLENVYKMTTYSSQMQIWKVCINTGGPTKEHPNTETWKVKKNDRSCVSFVSGCCNHPFSVIFHLNRSGLIIDVSRRSGGWCKRRQCLSMWDNLEQQSYRKERRACGQKRCGTGDCEIKSEEFSRLAPGSSLNRSRQLKLVKGRNEFVMSSLIIGQLHVSRPDHHNHIHSSFLGGFRFCGDRRTGEHTILKQILFRCEVNFLVSLLQRAIYEYADLLPFV